MVVRVVPRISFISIHAPREGGDGNSTRCCLRILQFQSTPPARGATAQPHAECTPQFHFNPRPPRGGRLGRVHVAQDGIRFQSTPPARGATWPCTRGARRYKISIHAPREGGDAAADGWETHHPNFNPRPPRGGRRAHAGRLGPHDNFNPRPPRGGRQKIRYDVAIPSVISIHAPREGGDIIPEDITTDTSDFNPRPPRGGRPRSRQGPEGLGPYFNPRPPRGGRQNVKTSHKRPPLFQSTPPARGATAAAPTTATSTMHFNPRPPRGGRP